MRFLVSVGMDVVPGTDMICKWTTDEESMVKRREMKCVLTRPTRVGSTLWPGITF